MILKVCVWWYTPIIPATQQIKNLRAACWITWWESDSKKIHGSHTGRAMTCVHVQYSDDLWISWKQLRTTASPLLSMLSRKESWRILGSVCWMEIQILTNSFLIHSGGFTSRFSVMKKHCFRISEINNYLFPHHRLFHTWHSYAAGSFFS